MSGARPTLRVHWLLVAIVLGVLTIGLAMQVPVAMLAPGLYRAVPAGSAGRVPASVSDGGPGIGMSGTQVTSIQPRPRTIALTFDDGPDPVWTPEIQAVLDRYGVHATFFVVGDEAVRHPAVVSALASHGNELGVHSFTHPDLGPASAGRVLLEARATQLMLVGATGRTWALFRPPFSSTPAAVDDAQWGTLRVTSQAGYFNVLTTVDSRDWELRDPDAIVRQLGQPDPAGQVVLFHDGGGDRSATVAALDRLIPQWQRQGYSVGTVSQALGLTSVSEPAPLPDLALGSVLLWGLWGCISLVSAVVVVMLAAGLLAVMRALLLLVAARRHRRVAALRPAAETLDPVTVIVPAFNESAGIEAAVRSLTASTHPVEIVVVDDGSTDDTAAVVASLELPGVRLFRQANAGKPAALNTGLSETRTHLVVMVDGDTVFEPDTVSRLVRPFADPRVGAVSGNAKVANRGGFLGRWQHIEYVIGFNMDRRFYDLAGCMPTVPGAVGAFRTDVLREVGGVSSDTLAEDTDLTMAVGRAGWSVVYAEDAVAWTEAPATLGSLWRQRYRWCYGTLQSMWKHRGGILQRGRGGRYSRRALSYLVVFQVLLPVLAPAVDLFALYGILVLDPRRIAAVWLSFQALDLIVATVAFRLDGERRGVLWALPLTQFCYRQLLYLVVIQSLATAVAGTRLRWHRVERYGTFAASESLAPGTVASVK